jgi:hypothetical protein
MKFWRFLAVASALVTGLAAADTESPPPEAASHYRLFIHSGAWKTGEGDAAAVNRVATALAERGYLVRPPDEARDDTGGASVDYFAETDKDIAQDVANVVNDVLYKGETKVRPRLQRIRNPPGYIGVWLYGPN